MVSRREVIESYIRYDSKKKSLHAPADMATWNWDSADAIDKQLQRHGYKHGILAGYVIWRWIELTKQDFSQCAVVSGIFPPTAPRVLAELADTSEFRSWQPDRPVEWFDRTQNGGDLPREWPLILRPAVAAERPAKWYLEDGSGRAICFFRRLIVTNDTTSKASGYLGVVADRNSSFMRNTFPELLARKSRY